MGWSKLFLRLFPVAAILFVVFVMGVPKALAQSCSEWVHTSVMYDCRPDDTYPGGCKPFYNPIFYQCADIYGNGQCLGHAQNQTCVMRNDQCQKVVGPPPFVDIPCGQGAGGGGGCTTTVPSAPVVDWNYSDTQVRMYWGPGEGGHSQGLAAGPNKADVIGQCAFNSCVVHEQNLPATQAVYLADKSLFTPDTTYYFKVWNIAGDCTTSSGVGKSTYTTTPAPAGTIRARAVEISPSDESCAAIRAVPTSGAQVNGAIHQFTPSA